jgi:hypothetical protein
VGTELGLKLYIKISVPGCTALKLSASSNAYIKMKAKKTKYRPGDKMTFACDKGYKQTGGNAIRSCTNDLIWNGLEIKCTGALFGLRFPPTLQIAQY